MFKKHLKSNLGDNSDTQNRVLDAAGEVFAEVGYRAATVRQICEKAGANIAAVNYYFGDKEGLYLAVLRSVPDAHTEKYPPQFGLTPDATAAQQLHAYVQSLLQRVFDAGRPGWHVKLVAREMAEPTRALDSLLEDFARPLHRELASIVRRLLGPTATDESVRLGALSVLGQCVYYHNARNVLTRLYPEQRYGVEDVARLVDHITEFSLAALRTLARRKSGAPQ
jgi:TetR/AcrR family transcriptional regulator, regulator of cefoperazone and chloramphenicol sensitivity